MPADSGRFRAWGDAKTLANFGDVTQTNPTGFIRQDEARIEIALPNQGMDGLEAFELQLDGCGGVGAHGISVSGGYGRDGEAGADVLATGGTEPVI